MMSPDRFPESISRRTFRTVFQFRRPIRPDLWKSAEDSCRILNLLSGIRDNIPFGSMETRMILVLALLIGVVAGLRSMVAPAAISWAAKLGWIDLSADSLAVFGYAWTPWILGLLALAELVTDQLPSTPSRKVPAQFTWRVITGAISGAALGSIAGMTVAGLAAGAIGAIIGTVGGAELRARLAKAFGSDTPAALIEDAIAIVAGLLVASAG